MKDLVMFSLEERKLEGNLIVAFQYLKVPCKKAVEGLFARAYSDRRKADGFKLKDGKFR